MSARLRMLKAANSSGRQLAELQDYFPGIRRGCSLTDDDVFDGASHVFLNPPYTLVRAPQDCQWRAGRVSLAALFMESVAINCGPGTRIAAVLPDVLRSGSGYARWRDMISRFVDIDSVQIVGRFARWADVDVFLLHGRIRTGSASRSWPTLPSAEETMLVHCETSVGPVVDYRSPKLGGWHPYLTVDNARPWGTVDAERLPRRRFSGRLVQPPFVVVRRTSRASDEHRAVATVVTGKMPVAIENHLIVMKPRRSSVPECNEIVARLRDSRTTAWLNERIRCRHLTVGAVSGLPWWGDADA